MRVLCVFAHPDDETLGCGATIAKYTEAGHWVRILIATTGATSRIEAREEDVRVLAEASKQAASILGATVTNLGLPDQRLDSLALLEINRRVEAVVNNFHPDVVFTHHQDLNRDHQIVREAVEVACRPQSGVKRLLACEIPSSTEVRADFVPNWYEMLDENHVDLKVKALLCYPEARRFPNGRSEEAIRSLAKWRGVGCNHYHAEAFELVRERR